MPRALLRKVGPCLRDERSRREIASRGRVGIARPSVRHAKGRDSVRPPPPPPPSHLPPRPWHPRERPEPSGQPCRWGGEVGRRSVERRGRHTLSAQAALQQLAEARVGTHLPG